MNHTENVGELLDLISAYQKSRVLFSFVELEIPEILSGGNFQLSKLPAKRKLIL